MSEIHHSFSQWEKIIQPGANPIPRGVTPGHANYCRLGGIANKNILFAPMEMMLDVFRVAVTKRSRAKGERARTPPFKARFGWMTSRACAWREMVKQAVTVLNYKGAKITEENIKDTLGPKWAWKMGKLFQSVWFVEDDWQELGTREEIAEHNFKVQARWLAGGGDPARKFWWHVTEITLDHLRPSPQWKRAMEDLQLAKEYEAATRRGLKELAERHKQEAEKHRMLREVLEELALGASFPISIQRPNNQPLPSWETGQT